MNEQFSPENQALKINTLETKFQNMQEQNFNEHKEIKESLVKMTAKLEELVEKMDKRYAPMWVKSIVVWLGITSGGAILVSLIRYSILHFDK